MSRDQGLRPPTPRGPRETSVGWVGGITKFLVTRGTSRITGGSPDTPVFRSGRGLEVRGLDTRLVSPASHFAPRAPGYWRVESRGTGGDRSGPQDTNTPSPGTGVAPESSPVYPGPRHDSETGPGSGHVR